MLTNRKLFGVFMILLGVFQYALAFDSLYVRRVSVLPTGEQAFDVKLRGNNAFIANDDSGLRVIDISNLATPLITTRFQTPHWTQRLFLNDTFVYMAARDSGLRILGAASPSTIFPIGRYTQGTTASTVRNIFIRDTIAYLAANTTGLVIVNIANPAQPTLLGSYTPAGTGQAYGIKVVDTLAYLADGSGGLVIIGVSDPRNPHLIGTAPIRGSSNFLDVVVDSNRAFIASIGGTKQYILDVSNPAAPTYLDSVTVDTARAIARQDTFIFYASGTMGMDVVSYCSGGHPIVQGYHHKMGSSTTPGYGRGIAVRDTFAFLASDAAGLVIYNFGAVLRQQHLYMQNPHTNDTIYSRDYVPISWTYQNLSSTDSVRIQLYRSNVPTGWITLGRTTLADTPFVWRVYNPNYSSPTSVQLRVVLMNDTSIIASSGNLRITAPHNPIVITSPAGGEAWPIGSRQVIRWQNSDSVLVSVGINRRGSITRFGTTRADSFVWTVTPDTSTLAYIRITQQPDSVYLYLSQPIVIVPFSAAEEPVIPHRFALEGVYPNPFNPSTTISYSLARSGQVELKLYDLHGREVALLVDRNEVAGSHRVTFDGTGFASGTYFLRLQSGGEVGLKKVVLVK